MFEKKITKTTKVTIKNLSIEDGKIVDKEGFERDLNKVILTTYNEGESFEFTVTAKTDDSEIVQEDGDGDSE